MFKVAIHSSISGRPLVVPIDHRGPGRGTAFVSEEPRVFFALVTAQRSGVEDHDLGTAAVMAGATKVATIQSVGRDFSRAIYSSRSATGIGSRAARIAGNSPPTRPIISA